MTNFLGHWSLGFGHSDLVDDVVLGLRPLDEVGQGGGLQDLFLGAQDRGPAAADGPGQGGRQLVGPRGLGRVDHVYDLGDELLGQERAPLIASQIPAPAWCSITCSPHSFFRDPAHRPDRSSPPSSTGAVHGQQPMLGYPWSCSGLYGTSWSRRNFQTSFLVHRNSGFTFTRLNFGS